MAFEYDEIIFAESTPAENPVPENQQEKQNILNAYYMMFNSYKV